MIYTLSWHANGGSNTLHMDGSTTPSGGIVTQSRIDAYTLPAGTYSYSAIIGNSSNDSPKVTIVNNANNTLIRMIINNGTIGAWSTGNGPYRNTFTLASQTDISIRYDNDYYMDNTAVFMTVYDQNSYKVEWRSVGNNTWPINQSVAFPLGPINTTYIDRVEGYDLPAGTYLYSGSATHDTNYYHGISLYDSSGNVVEVITDSIPPWSTHSYSGSFTIASPTTIYGKTGDAYYAYSTRLTLDLTRILAPDAPTNISWVDLYNGDVRVSFTPGSDGGSTITNYSYSLDGGSNFTALSPADPSSPITLTGLTNRTQYSLVLKAINGVGSGAASSPLSLYYMCFLEGTKILCYNKELQQEEERSIETLRKGDLVKTALNGYKPIDTIGTSKIYNPSNSMRSLNRLYRCPKESYPSLTEDLVITGCHSILVKNITEEERNTLIDIQEKIYVTEKHYRLIAAADKKAVPYEQEGVFNIWHFALEHSQYTFNYGVYANGLLVESSSMRMMREMSGMTLME